MPSTVGDERSDAETEGQQVDDRLDDRRGGRAQPVALEQRELAGPDALERGPLVAVVAPRGRGAHSQHLAGQQDEDVFEVGGAVDAVAELSS